MRIFASVVDSWIVLCIIQFVTSYFIRFVANEAQLKRDLRDKRSYVLYMDFASKREAVETKKDLDLKGEPVRCSDGRWRLANAGLCGFGMYNDEAECREALREGFHVGYGGGDLVTIWEGVYIDQADAGDGDMFRPTRLVTAFKRGEE
jgi:hypothetical protein